MYITKSKSLFLLLALFLSPLLLFGQLDEVPAATRQQWLNAYLLSEKADQQSNAGDTLGALDLLRQSWEILTEIQQSHPRWNPGMLAFRKENCRRKILILEAQEVAAIAALPREELAKFLRAARERLRLAHPLAQETQTDTDLEAPLPMPAQLDFLTRLNAEKQQFQAENSDLKVRLQTLREQLEQAELQAQAWRRTAAGKEKLQQELQTLKNQNQDLANFRQQAVLELHDLNSRVHTLVQELDGAKTALAELRRTPPPPQPPPPDSNAEDKIAAAQQEAAARIAAVQQEAAARIATAQQEATARIAAHEAESSRLVQEQWAVEQQRLKQLQEQLAHLKTELEQAQAAASNREKENKALADLIQKAVHQEQNGEWAEAAKIWQRISAARPGHIQTMARIPILLQQAGESAQAEQALNNYLSQAAGDFATLLSLGESCLQANQPAHAITFLHWCNLLQPDKVQAKAALGMAYAAAELPQTAESYLRQALALDNDYQPALTALAIILATAKPARIAEAKQLYRRSRKAGASPNPILVDLLQEP